MGDVIDAEDSYPLQREAVCIVRNGLHEYVKVTDIIPRLGHEAWNDTSLHTNTFR